MASLLLADDTAISFPELSLYPESVNWLYFKVDVVVGIVIVNGAVGSPYSPMDNAPTSGIYTQFQETSAVVLCST